MDCSLIAATFSWFSLESWIGIFWMVLGLGFIIFVHELGHFVAAKSCGVKVEAFYVGFNIPFPKLFGITIIPQYLFKFRIGETEYGIGNVPLGGYVKMLGQEDAPSQPESEQPTSAEDAENQEDSEGSQNSEAGSPATEAPMELDPRDYRAKSVIQRFWIISAGVIMNILTAPLFAMFAFWYGVPEEPARVGGVVPGAPAYQADYHPGDTIVQLGEEESKNEITFSDFQEHNALVGSNKTAVHYIIREGSDERIRKEVIPANDVIKIRYRTIAAVGISKDTSTRLAKKNAVIPFSAASEATPSFADGDVILKVNGEEVTTGAKMRTLIYRNRDREVTVEVARLGMKKLKDLNDETERVQIKIPPRKRKVLGLEMVHSPIVAVRANSPAAEAGIQKGDRLETLNGEPIGNLLTLSDRLISFVRDEKEITLGVKDSEGELREVKLTPCLPFYPASSFNKPISIDELGVAVEITDEVSVVVSGSAASEAGLQAGDVIKSAEFIPTDENRKEEESMGFPSEAYKFAEFPLAWPTITYILQNRLRDTTLKLVVERDDEEKEFTLSWKESDSYFASARGISLNQDQIMVEGGSLGHSFALGLKRVRKDIGRIYSFLHALVTGRVSVTSMGGPLMIGNVAVNFAMEGPGRFLVFLAFISVNLAIVNFLPIPVLDGGHAAFLIWEGVTGKPVNEQTQYIATLIGFAFLITLMLFVFSLDILTFFF